MKLKTILARAFSLFLAVSVAAPIFSVSAMAVGTDKTQWYYNQLSSTEKTLYKSLVSAISSVKPRVALSFSSALSKDSVERTFNAISFEQPKKFWLSGWGVSMSETGGEVKTSVYPVVTPQYGTPSDNAGIASELKAELIRSDTEAIDKIARRVAAGATGSDYDKLLYFNSWLTDNCEYDTAADSSRPNGKAPYTMAGVFLDGKAVCQGYALALKYLCDLVEIPCIFVPGTAISPSSTEPIAHAWNYVQLDGRWYVIDTTWNDPVGGTDESERMDFFLIGSETPAGGRTYNSAYKIDSSSFKFPALSKSAYKKTEKAEEKAKAETENNASPSKSEGGSSSGSSSSNSGKKTTGRVTIPQKSRFDD